MRLLPFFLLLGLPFAAWAQGYSHAPLLMVKPTPERSAQPSQPEPIAAPPAGTPTRLPDPAPSPAFSAAGSSVVDPAPSTAADQASNPAPGLPKTPAKLWPKDTIPIFMTRCTRFHLEMAKPCSCIITNVMTTMTHEAFLEINANNAMESDPRLIVIREKCVEDLKEQKRRPMLGGQ